MISRNLIMISSEGEQWGRDEIYPDTWFNGGSMVYGIQWWLMVSVWALIRTVLPEGNPYNDDIPIYIYIYIMTTLW